MKNNFERETYDALVKEFGKNCVKYEHDQFLYSTEHLYTPDFTVFTDDGVFHVESKGFLRPDHRRTLLAVVNQWSDPAIAIDLRLLFQKDQKVRKGGKMKYSDWAKKEGLRYAVGVKNIKEIF